MSHMSNLDVVRQQCESEDVPIPELHAIAFLHNYAVLSNSHMDEVERRRIAKAYAELSRLIARVDYSDEGMFIHTI